MIRVQVCEKYSLHIGPPDVQLLQALQSAAAGVKDEFLIAGFYQSARPKSIHGRRWRTGS